VPPLRFPGKPVQLLVEGRSTQILVETLARFLGAAEFMEVQDFGGVKDLRATTRAWVAASGFRDNAQVVGVIRDAETNAASALQSACDALRAAGLMAPARPAALSAGRPKTAVFIMPGGSRPGMLETLCWDASSNHAARECVEAYLRCLEEREISPHNREKARIQALLASRGADDAQVGRAAQQGFWDFNHPAFADLSRFVGDLVASARESSR
jgi:hypothetical protein